MAVEKVRHVAKRYLPLGVLAVFALSLEAFAAEVAFYPFTEGAAGSDAIGAAVRNAVDSSTLGGSVSLSKGTAATATFLDDVPGRYLYTNSTWTADSIYRSDVYQSVQLSWVTNKPGTVASGTTVSFADLGPRLAGLDAWTVEFFFKFDELLMSSYRSNVVLGDDENIAICLENKYNSSNLNPGVRAFCGGVLVDAKDWYDEVKNDLEKGEYEKALPYVDNWGIYVMISRYADCNGRTLSMPDGLAPDVEVEDDPLDGYALGDPHETMLATALSLIEGRTRSADFAPAPSLTPVPELFHPRTTGLLISQF